MNHPLIPLSGVLYPYLTWVEVSHVPHDRVHGMAMPHGVPPPCAMGDTAAGCPIPVYTGVAHTPPPTMAYCQEQCPTEVSWVALPFSTPYPYVTGRCNPIVPYARVP